MNSFLVMGENTFSKRGGAFAGDLAARVRSKLGSRGGQTMTEYALILAAIAVAGYAAYVTLAGGITTLINTVTTALKGT